RPRHPMRRPVMSSTSTADGVSVTGSRPVRDPRPQLSWGLGSFAAAGVVIVLGNTNLQPGENGGTAALVASLVLCAVVGGLVYGLLVPRAVARTRTALIVSIAAALSLVVFWSGLPIVLGPAAVL